jgi:hypothetical protein
VSKNSKHWSNEKGPSSTTKIVQRNLNNSESSNATSQCIWIQIFSLLLFYPFVLPVDLSEQAKSATADGQTY